MKEDIQGMKEAVDMDAMSITNLMMITQYLDTLRELGQNASKTVFVPNSPGVVGDLKAQIRNALMESGEVQKD